MGIDDWQEVSRKKFNVRSNADHTCLISTSIFVTNFPDITTSKDMWEVCKGYGNVVDVYIPNRKSKAGKRFAFVRFIKVENVDRLVGNLCTLWIGRLHLHANVVWFNRPPSHSPQPFHSARPTTTGASSFSSVLRGILENVNNISTAPSMVLADDCVVTRNLDNFVMGEVKDFSSINNLHVLLSNEGFQQVKLAYLGGLWIMIQLVSVKVKSNFLKHVGVASWFKQLCNAQPDFVSRERVVWVNIEGVPLHAWSRSTFIKLGSRWGEVLELEENKDDSKRGYLSKPLFDHDNNEKKGLQLQQNKTPKNKTNSGVFRDGHVLLKDHLDAQERKRKIPLLLKLTSDHALCLSQTTRVDRWSRRDKIGHSERRAMLQKSKQKRLALFDSSMAKMSPSRVTVHLMDWPPTTTGASSFASVLRGIPDNVNNICTAPTMVLADDCVVTRNLDNFVMGEIMIQLVSVKVKSNFLKHVGVASWFKQLCNAHRDFVSRERVVWVDIEGVPLHAWSRSTFIKIGPRWGEVLELEENKDDCFARKRICILVLPLDKTESIIYLRNLKSLSLLQLVPVRLFGTGQAAHIHEEKNREGVILLKLYYWKLGRAIMVDLKSRIPAMPIIQCEKLRQKQARRGRSAS
ncbi:RNA-directed DNA polymerase, eukaryota, nucleotide-binding alpha-beta plait domain protein [Tanacetum coccineum]|uniref:RNA-directed DNA polymerase, eukaryota, nucleotide-binding alpha-beta plait domain protein n=1 Tax=Tanacetum coccineum TaxID=301880 RepID=A0ABQ5C7G0_9ASTR